MQLGSEGKVDCKMDAKVQTTIRGADGKVQVDHNFLRITRAKADEEKKKRKANTIQYLEPQQGGRIIRPLPKTTNFKRKVRLQGLHWGKAESVCDTTSVLACCFGWSIHFTIHYCISILPHSISVCDYEAT